MKLILASNNNHKLIEIKAILGGLFEEIVSMREAGIEHETLEDGSTFMENAVKKALQASGKFLPWNVVTISTDGRILDRT